MKRSFSIFLISLLIVSLPFFQGSFSEGLDPHDVAVIDVTVFPEGSMYPSMNLSVFVVIENQGENYETFNVTAYVGNFTIQTLNVTDLQPGANMTLVFEWETFLYRMQIFPPPWLNPLHIMAKMLPLRAEADVVSGEVDTDDNVHYYGTVDVMWLVPDVEGNGKIDMRDIGRAARAFWSSPGDPSWDSTVDFNTDQKIDMQDIGTSARLFGTEYVSPWLAVEGGNKRSNYWSFVPNITTFENILENGDLETGSVDPWQGANIKVSSVFPIHGNHSLQVKDSDLGGYAYQTIMVEPNTTYVIHMVSCLAESGATCYYDGRVTIYDGDEEIHSRGGSFCMYGTGKRRIDEFLWNSTDNTYLVLNITFDVWDLVNYDAVFDNVTLKKITISDRQFNVSIFIKDLDRGWNLHNASLRLGFNGSVIQFHDVVFDRLWGTISHDYYPASPGSLDEIYLAVADPSDTLDGDVLLATIIFNVTYKTINLSSDGDYNDSPLDLYDITLFAASYELPTNPERDGLTRVLYYEPNNPWLAVHPSLVIFEGYPPSAVGEEFDIEIRTEGVHPGWDPKNVTLHLDFNDTVLLEMISISFSSLWNVTNYYYTPGTPGVSLGEIYMMAALEPDSIPTGDMLIATLTFNVTYQGYCQLRADISPLDLHDIMMFEEYQEIHAGEEDGMVIVESLV